MNFVKIYQLQLLFIALVTALFCWFMMTLILLFERREGFSLTYYCNLRYMENFADLKKTFSADVINQL